jgi:phosphatidylglycerophosphate synthase
MNYMTLTDPVPQRMSFSESLRRLDAAQKPGLGVPAYTRWVNRRAARYLCAAAERVGATPSSVSVLSLLVTFTGLGAFLALQSTPWLAGLCGAVLLALGYALDSADGQLARLQRTSSLQGEWLDHSLDAVRMPAVHLTIAVALLLQGVPVLAVLAAAFSVIASAGFLSQNLGGLLRDRSQAPRSQVRRHQSWLLLPADPGVLCWTFVLWVSLPLFGIVYLALFLCNALHFILSARRRWRELGEGATS